VHGRNRERAAAALAEIRDASGSELLRAYAGDLASLAQVRSLAESILAAEPRLDVLVNNAGIGTAEPGGGARVERADGCELRFAVDSRAAGRPWRDGPVLRPARGGPRSPAGVRLGRAGSTSRLPRSASTPTQHSGS
jgi:NAD(P)-dependent dehydrogenase (short-subunit alcohol dehydrogenase family)